MGIKKLSKYIKLDNISYEIQLKDLQYKKIAIDISVLLYQIIIAIRNSGDDLRNKKGDITSHILGLFNKTIWLISNNIIPIFIFDGKPPPFKEDTIKNRKNIRNKALEKLKNCTNEQDRIKYFKRTTNITTKQIQESKELLDLMGIPYLQADGEADILCAKLSEENFVDFVFTEDMDILTFGASKIVKNLFNKKPIEVIEKLKVLKHYDLTHKQFIIFCIILGCDYHNITFQTTKEEAINISKQYNFFSNIEFNNKHLLKNKIIEIFNYFYDNTIQNNFNFKINKQSEELLNTLVKKYDLIKNKIIWKVKILENKYKQNNQNNQNN